MMKDFGILLFGHTRPLFIADVLLSLEKQGALKYVDVWLDGHQANTILRAKTEQVYNVVSKFPVNKIFKHNGNLGFRKIMLQALSESLNKYDKLMILEDDCFPTRDAVEIFINELDYIKSKPEIFSVYGHHFLTKSESETCTRFQGWGWGTTGKKLRPVLEKLVDCYSLTEESYLQFVNNALTEEVIKRINVTPPRLPTDTLKNFFAWDETLALLTAQEGLLHKRTDKRTIFNFGASTDSSRYTDIKYFRKPPYNMVSHNEIWDYF